MTKILVPKEPPLPPCGHASFSYKRGKESGSYSIDDDHEPDDTGMSPETIARWLTRALHSSGFTTLHVMVKP